MPKYPEHPESRQYRPSTACSDMEVTSCTLPEALEFDRQRVIPTRSGSPTSECNDGHAFAARWRLSNRALMVSPCSDVGDVEDWNAVLERKSLKDCSSFDPVSTLAASRGFTLIELMIAIGIIAVLIGALVPSLQDARRSGRRVVCASNVRQLGVANHLYATDHGRVVPYSQFDGAIANRSGGLGVNVRWSWSDDTPGDPQLAFQNGLLYPYLGNSVDIAGCPEFEAPVDIVEFYAQFNLAYPVAVDYGYNGLLLGFRHENFYATNPNLTGYRSWVGYRPEEIGSSSTIAMFADAGDLMLGRVVPNPTISPPIGLSFPNGWLRAKPIASAHGRHVGETVNVTWADGHATSIRVRQYVNQSPETIAKRLGYVAPDIGGERSNKWMFVK